MVLSDTQFSCDVLIFALARMLSHGDKEFTHFHLSCSVGFSSHTLSKFLWFHPAHCISFVV